MLIARVHKRRVSGQICFFFFFLRRGPILVGSKYATLLEWRILKWFLGFWKMCGPLFYFIYSFISCSQTRNNNDNIKKGLYTPGKTKDYQVVSRKLMSQKPDETEHAQRTIEMMEHGRIAGGKIIRKGE